MMIYNHTNASQVSESAYTAEHLVLTLNVRETRERARPTASNRPTHDTQ